MRQSSHSTSINVIGAGVAGTWQALMFAKAGCKVAVYERSNASMTQSTGHWAGGMLAPAMPLAVVVRVVRLAVVATVVFWARGELSDAELRAYLRLRMAESLLPHAAPGGGAIIACAQGATRQLADLAASAPAMEG